MLHFPIQRDEHHVLLSPHYSFCEIRAKILFSYTDRPGAWVVIWVEPVENIVSTPTEWHNKNAQRLRAESSVDRYWGRTQSSYAETA